MAPSIFTLRFVDEERGLTIKLTSLPEDLTSLGVVLFEPNDQIRRVWMIEEHQLTAGEWRTRINLSAVKEGEELMVYCLRRSADCPSGDFHEVITKCKTSIGGLNQSVVQTLDCRRRCFQPHDIDYLTGQGKRTELNLRTRLTPPNTYRVLLSDESQINKPILMIFGLKNITYVTTKYLMLTTPTSPEIEIPLTFPTKSIYKCAVVELTRDGESFQCGRISDVIFKSVMTKEELETLQQKAKVYFKTTTSFDVQFLHRTKPKAVMDAIMNERNGLMETHMKNNNGDPHSAINGNISGVFFTVHFEYVTERSPFGDRRLYIPVGALFNEETNLYFADFYCVGGPHYVTLVLTRPGTDTDNFCKDFLQPLDKANNRFVFLEDGKVRAMEKKQCYIEIFYTENVDIRSLQNRYGPKEVYFKDVEAFGMGDCVESGYPKIPGCKICNI